VQRLLGYCSINICCFYLLTLTSEYGCVGPGGVLSIQTKHSGGVHSTGEGTVEDSQRLHSDHEDGTGKTILMHHILHL